MDVERVFTAVAVAFEVIGAIAMCIGFAVALVLGARSLHRGEGGQAAFQVLRTTLGSAILLGLEVLVAADLIRTITSKPSMEEALILGVIVLIRTVLSGHPDRDRRSLALASGLDGQWCPTPVQRGRTRSGGKPGLESR